MRTFLLLVGAFVFNGAFAMDCNHETSIQDIPAVVKLWDSYYVPRLHAAVYKNNLIEMDRFLKAGDPVDVLNCQKQTPLHVACEHGHIRAIEILLSAGAQLNPTDTSQSTPLHLAVRYGGLPTVEFFIQKKPNILAQDGLGKTALHYTSATRRATMVKLLINENNSVLNLQDNNGMTPLHLAIIGNHDSIVRTLLRSGASASLRDNMGRLPIYYAMQQKNTKMTALLATRRNIGQLAHGHTAPLAPTLKHANSHPQKNINIQYVFATSPLRPFTQALAFTMASHYRTGKKSPAYLLHSGNFRLIYIYLKKLAGQQ